jgi:hypothetical protein
MDETCTFFLHIAYKPSALYQGAMEVRIMDRKIGLALIGVLVLSIVGTSALAMGWGRGSDAVKTAVVNGDYNAYVEAGNNMTKQMLSEDQFNQMVKRYQLEKPVMDARTNAAQAITDKNFAEWKEAMTTMIDAEKARLDAEKADLTQEKFDALVSGNDDDHFGMKGPGNMMGFRGHGRK